MVSNGNQGNSPPTFKRHLQIVGRELQPDEQVQPLSAHAQASSAQTSVSDAQVFSFCMSTELGIARISHMAERGYKLQSMAGSEGKLAILFGKDADATNLTLIATAADQSPLLQNYRLSAKTLEHVYQDGNHWLFAYSDNRRYPSQRILMTEGYEDLLQAIKRIWRLDYRITSMACKGSQWLAVASQLPQLYEQSYFTAPDLDCLQEMTRQAWKEGKTIKAITYGEGRWLVMLDKEPARIAQKWYTKRSFIDLRNKTREEWSRGFRVTALAKSDDLWMAVVSKS